MQELPLTTKEVNETTKNLISNFSIITFCNQLPELFRLAEPQVKKEIIQTCIRTISYNGETLKIELFPIFYKLKYWKKVKNGAGSDSAKIKMRTVEHFYEREEPTSFCFTK